MTALKPVFHSMLQWNLEIRQMATDADLKIRQLCKTSSVCCRVNRTRVAAACFHFDVKTKRNFPEKGIWTRVRALIHTRYSKHVQREKVLVENSNKKVLNKLSFSRTSFICKIFTEEN
ncbi:hypothetical protein TNCV_1172891 [Trichonephila clavipes]|uniref:Uncharacterized protein n=1 Tax=Trichonephila clavipes TaxID=2585209 RepID=A0A8X6S045_TRICX|nr:hypothetical protein TNCV_1172891 [Trichonephila clavipes]